MITLRNRYNIEKRRVENSSLTSSIVGSQWPLFDNLSFLSEHIRSRRSYKMQSKSLDGRADEDEDEEHFDVDDMTNLSNEVNIKHELDSGEYDETDDYDCDRQLPVTTVLKWVTAFAVSCESPKSSSHFRLLHFRSIPMATQQTTSQQCYSTQRNGNNMINGKCAPPNNVNSHLMDTGTGLKHKRMAPPSLEEAPSKRRLDAENILKAATVMAGTEGREFSRAFATTTATAATTYPKFRAFGEFVTHSLTELPHTTSMRLVEKFTRELVQAAIAIDEQQLSQSKAQQQQQQQHREQGSAEPSSMDEIDE